MSTNKFVYDTGEAEANAQQREFESLMTLDEVNENINSIFASNDVLPDGPGEEAFWNAVERVGASNPLASRDLQALSARWMELRGSA